MDHCSSAYLPRRQEWHAASLASVFTSALESSPLLALHRLRDYIMFHLHSDSVQIHPACSGRASAGEMNVAAFTTNMEHHYANEGEITHLREAPVKKIKNRKPSSLPLPHVWCTTPCFLHFTLGWGGGGKMGGGWVGMWMIPTVEMHAWFLNVIRVTSRGKGERKSYWSGWKDLRLMSLWDLISLSLTFSLCLLPSPWGATVRVGSSGNVHHFLIMAFMEQTATNWL